MSALRRSPAFLAALASAFLAPLTTFAQTSGTSLNNPLSSQFNTIPTFLAGALKVMVEVALPVIAVFFVVAGFQFIAARGKPDKLQKAKWNFLYVVLGALLILGAWVIANLIGATVTQVLGS